MQKPAVRTRRKPGAFGAMALLVVLFAGVFSLAQAIPAYAQYPGFGDPTVGGGANASGGFVPVQTSVDGGAIPLGATAQVVVRFRNETGQPVQTGLIRLYPSSTVSGDVALNQCAEGSLDPGAECAIALTVKALQAGPWRIEMLMTHSARSRLVAATLSGTVDSGGEGGGQLRSDIEAIPSDVDFGSLSESQTLVQPVVLRNITSKSIEVSKIYIDTSEQAGYSLESECETLLAGQACIAMVTWSPKLKGRSSGVLVVEHSGPTGLSSVPLKGQYEPTTVEQAEIFPSAIPGRGLLVSSQTQIDFGASVESASTITVSLVNAGDTDLKINDIKIGGSDNGLGFKAEGCQAGEVLEPVEACPLTITWSPTRVGPLYDDIQILHDGTRGVLVLPVRGEAVAAVSQDQKSIVLSGGPQTTVIPDTSNDPDMEAARMQAASDNAARVHSDGPVAYAASQGAVSAAVLDGYKITSFSPDRAIINGPGGSRIVFNNEEIVLGGAPWFVRIQRDGIEFSHANQRVLMLFDRSLSSISRTTSSSSSAGN